MIKSLRYVGWEKAQGGHLVKDSFSFVNSFQSISFSHIVQQDNAIACALAQRERHSFLLAIWSLFHKMFYLLFCLIFSFMNNKQHLFLSLKKKNIIEGNLQNSSRRQARIKSKYNSNYYLLICHDSYRSAFAPF